MGLNYTKYDASSTVHRLTGRSPSPFTMNSPRFHHHSKWCQWAQEHANLYEKKRHLAKPKFGMSQVIWYPNKWVCFLQMGSWAGRCNSRQPPSNPKKLDPHFCALNSPTWLQLLKDLQGVEPPGSLDGPSVDEKWGIYHGFTDEKCWCSIAKC